MKTINDIRHDDLVSFAESVGIHRVPCKWVNSQGKTVTDRALIQMYLASNPQENN